MSSLENINSRCRCSLCPSDGDDGAPAPFQHQVNVLPQHVKGILGCARNEIDCLSETLEDEDALDDGFMFIDLNVLTTKLQKWYELLSPLSAAIVPYFAIKCNPDPMIVHWLARHSGLDIGFDCASVPELELACRELRQIQVESKLAEPVENGVALADKTSSRIQRIVYANPQRAEFDLLSSLRLVPLHQPLWLTFDGLEELSKMKWACQEGHRDPSTLQLIIRILVPDSHSQVPLGEKFGTALCDVSKLAEKATEFGFPVIGVSFHCGSGCHDPETYQTALHLAAEALDMIESITDKKCWLLDIGGGFPGWDGIGGDLERFSSLQPSSTAEAQIGEMHAAADENAAEIAKAICPQLAEFQRKRPNLTIIAEPGRYFVEASACLTSRIYKITEDPDGTMVYQIAHGVHGVFKDVLLCNEAFIPKPLKSDTTSETSSKLLPSRVRGPSGDPLDIVCESCMLPKLEIGDWLVFDRMGAYTLSIASRSGRPVIRYVLGGQASSNQTQ